ncbi:MAG TPA: type II toxin-antitoxin system HigB family toxin [Rudaea sp.]|nr:type II toxin-antitoxin system HigB family toxin [Rudaea sp.]
MDFTRTHRAAGKPLQAWRKVIESGTFANFAQLKAIMNAADRVGDFYVFDIGGNKFRVIAAIHFNRQMLFVRHVFTHAEYDRWSAGQ